MPNFKICARGQPRITRLNSFCARTYEKTSSISLPNFGHVRGGLSLSLGEQAFATQGLGKFFKSKMKMGAACLVVAFAAVSSFAAEAADLGGKVPPARAWQPEVSSH
jgi:hypothetical protein